MAAGLRDKIMKHRIIVLATLCATTHMQAFAQESNAVQEGNTEDASKVEEIIVLGRSISTQSASVDIANEMLIDTAKALENAYRIPMDVIIDQIVTILQILPLRDTVELFSGLLFL